MSADFALSVHVTKGGNKEEAILVIANARSASGVAHPSGGEWAALATFYGAPESVIAKRSILQELSEKGYAVTTGPLRRVIRPR
jgi:hypothetical protein